MDKKEVLQICKYWKMKSLEEGHLRALQRFLRSKRPSIKYKFKKWYITQNNNIYDFDYALSELTKNTCNFDFVSFTFWMAGTRFKDFYIIIDNKMYFKCFILSKKDEVKQMNELEKYLISK